jgi:hypothetical protein
MSSMKSKRFASSRGTTALVLAGVLVLGFGLTAMAQSVGTGSHNGPEGTWRDGLEGTWRAQLTVRDCQSGVALRTFPTIFEYAIGGTLTYTTAGQLPSLSTTGLGVWKHMDGHTYKAVSEVFIFSPAGAWTSTHRLTRVIEVSRDAKGYTDTIALEIFDTNRNLIGTGCATAVASRME